MEHIKKILVVDDEMGIRSLISELLESEGFEVRAAKDGQESLDEMEREDFDLVITDIQMPRLDGLAMLDAMKRAGRKEKIIIMTGSAFAMDLPNEEMPMVVSRLQKPFRMSNLLDVVSAANAGADVMH
jgi:two-component system response regulator (stage 0 sporulation protein F)